MMFLRCEFGHARMRDQKSLGEKLINPRIQTTRRLSGIAL